MHPLHTIGRILVGAAIVALLVHLELDDAARRSAAAHPAVVLVQR